MSFAKQVLLLLRLIKLRRFWGSFFYPLQRDWLERFYLARWQQEASPFPYGKPQLHLHGIELQ